MKTIILVITHRIKAFKSQFGTKLIVFLLMYYIHDIILV